jgi:hypothetical protein
MTRDSTPLRYNITPHLRTSLVRSAQRWLMALIICGVVPGCARHRPPRTDYGIPRCAPGAGDNLLAVSALQCWFDAPHGRWRIIEHHSLYQELVVDVEAVSLSDADRIGRRFVASAGAVFSEMLIYVRPESIEFSLP